MEVKLNRNTQPNKNNLILQKVVAFFKAIGTKFADFGKKIWNFLCKSTAFSRFAYITFPAWRNKTQTYIKERRLKIFIPILVGIIILAVLLAVNTKDTGNSDYYADGNDEIEFGMVLQNYSTFNHIEKTHIAIKLSWEDGAVELKDGMAQAKLKAKVYPVNLENRKIIWKSSDENIARVDMDGNITAVASGEVQISATLAREDKTAVAKLSVRQSVSGIFMPTSTITLYEGSTGRLLSATVFPEDATNKNVVWKSKNTKVARVDQTGRVNPVGVGMTEVIATTEDGSFEAKCFVNVVSSYVDVREIELVNGEDMHIKTGDSINAIVTVSPSNARNKTLKWSSDDDGIATVSQTGRIRGIGEGKANITVESVNGKKQTFAVEVAASDEKDPFILYDEEEDVPTLAASGGVKYTSYDVTFPQALRIQMQGNPSKWNSGGSLYATEAETAEYMNPNSYYTDAYKYQFLDLSKSNNVSAEVLDEFLKGKGVLEGMGSVFVEAGKAYNVSEVYLVAHACLETGNGTSQLARGVEVNGTTVYNMFGIGAYDSGAVYNGSQKAYKEGWTSVESAIMGGAEWISRFYINSADGRQNTLYKMRWNPENPGEHEYASDIGWAVKQAISIEKIFSQFANATLSFDVPVYSGQIPPALSDY